MKTLHTTELQTAVGSRARTAVNEIPTADGPVREISVIADAVLTVAEARQLITDLQHAVALAEKQPGEEFNQEWLDNAYETLTAEPPRKMTTINVLAWPVRVGREIVGGGCELGLACGVAAQQSAERPGVVVDVYDAEDTIVTRYRDGAELPPVQRAEWMTAGARAALDLAQQILREDTDPR